MRMLGCLGSMAALLCAVACSSTPPKAPAQARAEEIIAAQVYSALDADPVFFFRHVDVEADDGIVYLSGYIWSAPAIYRARSVAGAVPGVKKVVDQMELERQGSASGGGRGH